MHGKRVPDPMEPLRIRLESSSERHSNAAGVDEKSEFYAPSSSASESNLDTESDMGGLDRNQALLVEDGYEYIAVYDAGEVSEES